MKHAYLITNTAYKMLNRTSFLEIKHRYDIRRYVQKPKHRFKYIEILKDVF